MTLATNLIDKTYNLITMTKKFIVLFLMLLLPITIWAQNSVMFDFSSSSQNDVVPRVMEKDGINVIDFLINKYNQVYLQSLEALLFQA